MNRNELVVGSCLLAALAGSVVAMGSPAPTPARNPQLPGLDVSISCIGANISGAKDLLVYNQGSGSVTGLPAGSGMFTLTMGTTSCNQQPTSAPTTRLPANANDPTLVAGSPFWMGDWYQAWESGINWDGTSLGTNAGNRHPYIAQAIYRINASGRLEQLATSWVKHSFSAASESQSNIAGTNGQDLCGNGSCDNMNTDNQLEPNCSDTYWASLNASQSTMGPRSEISSHRPWSEAGWNNPGWNRTNSYFDNYTGSETLAAVASRGDGNRSQSGGTLSAWKLSMVRYDEVDQAALGASGRVICEGYYVVNGDNYQLNNVAHRQFTSSVATGATTISSSNFNFAGRHTWGPAVLQWGEQKSVADPQTDGEVYISSRAVSLGGGLWRYEYNVYNHNLDRQISSFEVPVPSVANTSDFGVFQPRTNWPGYDNGAAWDHAYDGTKKAIVWTPPAAPVLTDAQLAALRPEQPAGTVIKQNNIRWGQMFTFWFTCDLDPRSDVASSMGLAQAGSFSGNLTAEVRGPRHPADLGAQGGIGGADGQLDNNDFVVFIDYFFNNDMRADMGIQGGTAGHDGLLDNNDFVAFINFFFTP